MVTTYKLSAAAQKSITGIVAFTDETFGPHQTEAYIAGLEASFNLLVRFPGVGAAMFELKPGLRRYRYQSHHIYYSRHATFLLIEDVIQVRRNLRRDLVRHLTRRVANSTSINQPWNLARGTGRALAFFQRIGAYMSIVRCLLERTRRSEKLTPPALPLARA